MARIPRRTVTIATVLVALALGSVITDRLPKPADITGAPAVHDVRIGEPLQMQSGTFTVTGLRAAPVLAGLAASNRTAGTYLVLDFEFTAVKEPSYLNPVNLRVETKDGRTFRGGAASGGACPSQPGLTTVCHFAVEVDKEALAGATVILPAEGWVFGPPVLEEAHLEIDDAAAADLAARTEPIHIEPSRPKGA